MPWGSCANSWASDFTELPRASPFSKALTMYTRVKRFLTGHYEEFLAEFSVLGAWLVASLVFFGGSLWPF